MSNSRLMFAYTAQLLDGSVKSGSLAVPGEDPATAAQAVAGIVRCKYRRDLEDLSVTCLGVA
jgi:hypothetical protein